MYRSQNANAHQQDDQYYGYGDYGQQQPSQSNDFHNNPYPAAPMGGTPQGFGGGGFIDPTGGAFGGGGAAGQQVMMDFAQRYGEQFAATGKERLEKIVSVSTLKYYFAVDNAYVGKKLLLLLFPFAHMDWSVKYDQTGDEPVPPRFDVNAQDLYIPVMGFVTYILVAGIALGVQDMFTPEMLGILATSALAWLVFENGIILVTKYVMGISKALRFYDVLAFSGYKYIGMIVCLILFLLGGRFVYHCAVVYFSIAIAFFLIRSVKVEVLGAMDSGTAAGRKRKLYLLLYISLTQPFIIYWLTSTVAVLAVPGKFIPKDMLEEAI